MSLNGIATTSVNDKLEDQKVNCLLYVFPHIESITKKYPRDCNCFMHTQPLSITHIFPLYECRMVLMRLHDINCSIITQCWGRQEQGMTRGWYWSPHTGLWIEDISEIVIYMSTNLLWKQSRETPTKVPKAQYFKYELI